MLKELKERAIRLRKSGNTYAQISEKLKVKIPKSTLSEWCRGIPLPAGYQRKIREYNLFTLQKARESAREAIEEKKREKIKAIRKYNSRLAGVISDKDMAKTALAMLYLGEGFKNPKRGSLAFGNSDAFTISLFLYLLRFAYNIDESKFRCTVQCRADQDTESLEKYWSRITLIPLKRFYKPLIDRRTIAKPTKKADYKGVCKIDYFSADIFHELLELPKIIFKGP
ncbi:MAG TPA: hypothetical protein P5080_05490 [Candidatus Paceibacterota bacterium]|nr:hypothetical protein [Candidatus Pacearchaeota archaeon]HRZ51400.1 hypothetical protein [Candidatus Paceibacterota bacterium]HSA37122.1 hypothetical protein [Candidatus Paceibacterota bacterium]